MELMLLLWVGLAVAVGVVASARGRSGLGHCLLSLIVSPLIGLLILIALPVRNSSADQRIRTPCPRCAELVVPQAVQCPHCGYAVAAHIAAKAAEATARRNAQQADRSRRAQARGRRLAALITGRKPD